MDKRKGEEKEKKRQECITSFSTNVTKVKQTTCRKKMLEKINIDGVKPSSRRYPGIIFTPNRETGNKILEVHGLSKSTEDKVLFKDVNFQIEKDDKVIFLSKDPRAMSALFEIINGLDNNHEGSYEWGQTITTAYLPLDNSEFSNTDFNLIDCVSQYSKDTSDLYINCLRVSLLFKSAELFK